MPLHSATKFGSQVSAHDWPWKATHMREIATASTLAATPSLTSRLHARAFRRVFEGSRAADASERRSRTPKARI
jgi:hypothetical protein